MVDLDKIAKALSDPDKNANGWVCCARPEDLDAMVAELRAARAVTQAARRIRLGYSDSLGTAHVVGLLELDAALAAYDREVQP
jgi:hypothetical protein